LEVGNHREAWGDDGGKYVSYSSKFFISKSNYLSVLHILDSLQHYPPSTREADELQKILLKHFEGKKFKSGRISTNLPKVSLQTLFQP
jgi:hypothetical protein